jgi:cardiolipin synthase
MSLPNLITIARILLVPLTVWLIISQAYGVAFLTIVVAGVSDAVDGYIARRFNLRTELGSYLDPIADKVLLVSVYVTLGFMRLLPDWLVILVVSRDMLIVGAFLLSWLMDRPFKIKPLLVSKVNTAAQIALAVAVLGMAEAEFDAPEWRVAAMAVVALLTAASGALYLREWIAHMANGAPDGSA